jgi:hypothetical protein
MENKDEIRDTVGLNFPLPVLYTFDTDIVIEYHNVAFDKVNSTWQELVRRFKCSTTALRLFVFNGMFVFPPMSSTRCKIRRARECSDE